MRRDGDRRRKADLVRGIPTHARGDRLSGVAAFPISADPAYG